MRPSGGVLYLFLALTVVSAAPVHPLARRSIVVDYKIGDVADADNSASNTLNDKMNNRMQNSFNGLHVVAPFVEKSFFYYYLETGWMFVSQVVSHKYRPVLIRRATRRKDETVRRSPVTVPGANRGQCRACPPASETVTQFYVLTSSETEMTTPQTSPLQVPVMLTLNELDRDLVMKQLKTKPRDAMMRPSGGLLYLFLALTLVRAAPGHPLARRSVDVELKILPVPITRNRASNRVDLVYNNVDVPAELVDVTVSGNDDTGDVTSPGPGDADPERASTDSVTLS
uniref:Uncharacterized protein n=1 Tax=Branchiostoma floridae TaxID=7739 RepID=C3YHS9_BRAFL|eukprot:XP_002604055.1 hypothetical protein BRAFLDRAFT_71655 [Branchiostoma floridae]